MILQLSALISWLQLFSAGGFYHFQFIVTCSTPTDLGMTSGRAGIHVLSFVLNKTSARDNQCFFRAVNTVKECLALSFGSSGNITHWPHRWCVLRSASLVSNMFLQYKLLDLLSCYLWNLVKKCCVKSANRGLPFSFLEDYIKSVLSSLSPRFSIFSGQ